MSVTLTHDAIKHLTITCLDTLDKISEHHMSLLPADPDPQEPADPEIPSMTIVNATRIGTSYYTAWTIETRSLDNTLLKKAEALSLDDTFTLWSQRTCDPAAYCI